LSLSTITRIDVSAISLRTSLVEKMTALVVVYPGRLEQAAGGGR
jgi:hypothetical protein